MADKLTTLSLESQERREHSPRESSRRTRGGFIVLLFLVLLTMGGVIGLRTLRFIEELLESHAGSSVGEVPAGRGTARRTRTGREAGASHDGYATLVCEVSGLREDLGEPDEVQSMCRDIQTMLSRRVRVQNVAFLPTAPSRAILLIRTEPLKSSLKEMVRDGIRWYLEEHRERLANGKEFPGMQWIDLASAGSDLPDAAPAVAGGKPAAQPEKVPLPLRKGQAPLAG